jgi:hypothetical protein
MKLEIATLEAIDINAPAHGRSNANVIQMDLSRSSKHVYVQEAINNSKELISSTLMPLVEYPADPKLEPPRDPRLKPMMVQARTKTDP